MSKKFEGTRYTEAELKRSSHLKPVVQALDAQYGPGKWGLREVAQYKEERRAAREEQRAEVDHKVDDRQKRVERRVKDYLKTFTNITPNDQMALQAMAEIEISMEEISAKKARLGLDAKTSDLSNLVQIETKYSAEHRQLQTMLGIDRANRETQEDTAEAVERFVKGARALLAEHTLKIGCLTCRTREESPRDVNMGHVLFHFRQDVAWSFFFRCPECATLWRLDKDGFHLTAEPGDSQVDFIFEHETFLQFNARAARVERDLANMGAFFEQLEQMGVRVGEGLKLIVTRRLEPNHEEDHQQAAA